MAAQLLAGGSSVRWEYCPRKRDGEDTSCTCLGATAVSAINGTMHFASRVRGFIIKKLMLREVECKFRGKTKLWL